MSTPTEFPPMNLVQTYNALLPVDHLMPLVNPAPNGLYASTSWVDIPADQPSRFLGGVAVRNVGNYGGESAFGVWGQPWCGDPGDSGELKYGTRPTDPEVFEPITVWAYDQCDLTEPSREEVRTRAQQSLRLNEQTAVERSFADRLLADTPPTISAPDIVAALGHIEAAFAKTNTLGFIHISPHLIPVAAANNLVVRSGGGGTAALKTNLGHTWVSGGGYGEGLGNTLVATSPTYGWRDQAQVREAIDYPTNTFAVVAERSVVVAYEHAVASATVAPLAGRGR
jgi:hypothetical protein